MLVNKELCFVKASKKKFSLWQKVAMTHVLAIIYFRTSGPSVAGLETTYTGGNGFSTSYNSQRWLNLYLSACKFLDLALALPSENLPQFQM